MTPDPTGPAPQLRVVPVPADLDDRVEYRRAITRVLRAVPDVVLCESCGRWPAAATVDLPDTATRAHPFRVCTDCAAPAPVLPAAPAAAPAPAAPTASPPVDRVTITSADPAAGLGPRDPQWAGTVRIQRRWADLVWPAVFCLTAPLGALTAWLLSGNPVVMFAAAAFTFAGVLCADHRRDRLDG